MKFWESIRWFFYHQGQNQGASMGTGPRQNQIPTQSANQRPNQPPRMDQRQAPLPQMQNQRVDPNQRPNPSQNPAQTRNTQENQETDRRHRKQIALKCIDETGVDRRVIEKVLETNVLPPNSDKYKQFLVCSYKRQGYLSLDGRTMLYSNIEDFLSRFYSRTDLAALNVCKSIKANSSNDLVYNSLSCILSTLEPLQTLPGVNNNWQ